MDRDELIKRLEWYQKRHGPYIEKRGLHNWKNLFRMPTINEWVILVLLIGYFLIAQLYTRDVAICKETLLNLEADACAICGNAIQQEQMNETEKYGRTFEELNISGLVVYNQGG